MVDDAPAWWQQYDEWGTFRGRVEQQGAVSQDGDVLGAFFDLYRYSCQPSVRFEWDQWARCHIS